ncbi:MAG: hypothetical protein IJ242_15410 [Clostridia bacterium]|nr:hypothetical protein [Clostridia bacterium]
MKLITEKGTPMKPHQLIILILVLLFVTTAAFSVSADTEIDFTPGPEINPDEIDFLPGPEINPDEIDRIPEAAPSAPQSQPEQTSTDNESQKDMPADLPQPQENPEPHNTAPDNPPEQEHYEEEHHKSLREEEACDGFTASPYWGYQLYLNYGSRAFWVRGENGKRICHKSRLTWNDDKSGKVLTLTTETFEKSIDIRFDESVFEVLDHTGVKEIRVVNPSGYTYLSCSVSDLKGVRNAFSLTPDERLIVTSNNTAAKIIEGNHDGIAGKYSEAFIKDNTGIQTFFFYNNLSTNDAFSPDDLSGLSAPLTSSEYSDNVSEQDNIISPPDDPSETEPVNPDDNPASQPEDTDEPLTIHLYDDLNVDLVYLFNYDVKHLGAGSTFKFEGFDPKVANEDELNELRSRKDIMQAVIESDSNIVQDFSFELENGGRVSFSANDIRKLLYAARDRVFYKEKTETSEESLNGIIKDVQENKTDTGVNDRTDFQITLQFVPDTQRIKYEDYLNYEPNYHYFNNK